MGDYLDAPEPPPIVCVHCGTVHEPSRCWLPLTKSNMLRSIGEAWTYKTITADGVCKCGKECVNAK